MKNNSLAIALAALLVGGVATAAYVNNKDLDYATVLDVQPVNQKQEQYAQVISAEPVRETNTVSSPREVCNDVVVQKRLPERDGNVGGTVAGAIIGGLVGNQIGGGDGKKLATAGGAVAGGMIGNRVDRNHVGGQVVATTQRECHNTTATSRSSNLVGYDVTYKAEDGSTGSTRTQRKPGERISLGTKDVPVAYDVTYQYEGQQRTVRLPERPAGERLPIVDGQPVVKVAAIPGTDRR